MFCTLIYLLFVFLSFFLAFSVFSVTSVAKSLLPIKGDFAPASLERGWPAPARGLFLLAQRRQTRSSSCAGRPPGPGASRSTPLGSRRRKRKQTALLP